MDVGCVGKRAPLRETFFLHVMDKVLLGILVLSLLPLR